MKRFALVAAGLPLLTALVTNPVPAGAFSGGQWSGLGAFEESPANQVGPYSQDYPLNADGTPASASFTEHCYQSDLNGPGYLTCKPAGVSTSVMPDGRILYWNGLSGLENVKHITAAEAAWASQNSEARLLYLQNGTPRFAGPCPTGVQSTLLAPCLSSVNVTNPDHGVNTNYPLPGNNGTGQTNPNAEVDLFCSDQVALADGRLLIAGGTFWHNTPDFGPVPAAGLQDAGVVELQGSRTSRIFDPATNTFTGVAPMNNGRWYPNLIELGDGRVFVGGGVHKLLQTEGTNVRQTEIYDAAANTWTVNPNGDAAMPLFPRYQLLPNGTVYYSGVGQNWGPFGESADQGLYGLHQAFDPNLAGGSWDYTHYGGFGLVGARSGAFSVLMPLHPDPTSGAYNHADVLVGGGTLGAPPGAFLANNLVEKDSFDFAADGSVTSAATTIDPNGQLNLARWYSSSAILPNDDISVFNGANKDEVVFPGSESPVHGAEIYSHVDHQFHNAVWDSHDRTYHNTAILLPDGSVLVGGHSPIPAGYGNYTNAGHDASAGTPAATSNNFKDPSFEIYQPDYFNRADRPALLYAPARAQYGDTVTIAVNTGGNPLYGIRLVRMPAQTHIVDGNMRSVDLPYRVTGTDNSGNTLISVDVPKSGNIAPPAPYYLFADTTAADGTVLPSRAAVVTVGNQATNLFPALSPFGVVAASATTVRVPGSVTSVLGSTPAALHSDSAPRRSW